MNTDWTIKNVPQIAPDFEHDPYKTALLLIDLQYAGGHPDYGSGPFIKETYPDVYSYYFPRLEKLVIPNNRKLLAFFRQHGLRIIYVAMGSQLPDSSDLTPLRKQRTKVGKRWAGSDDFRIRSEIEPQDGELLMLKTAANAFNSSMLDQTLRHMGMEGLVITGVVTNACVEMTARDASDRGYKTTIVEDAVAAWSQEMHEAALRTFATMHGDVVSTEALCEDFRARL